MSSAPNCTHLTTTSHGNRGVNQEKQRRKQTKKKQNKTTTKTTTKKEKKKKKSKNEKKAKAKIHTVMGALTRAPWSHPATI